MTEAPVPRVTEPAMRRPTARREARCEAAPMRVRPLWEPAACLGWSGLQAMAARMVLLSERGSRTIRSGRERAGAGPSDRAALALKSPDKPGGHSGAHAARMAPVMLAGLEASEWHVWQVKPMPLGLPSRAGSSAWHQGGLTSFLRCPSNTLTSPPPIPPALEVLWGNAARVVCLLRGGPTTRAGGGSLCGHGHWR